MAPRGQWPPHQGNRPHNAIPRKKQARSCDPKGVVPSLGPLSGAVKETRQDDRQDTDHYKYPYNNANTKRQVADKMSSIRNAQEWFTGGPHAEGGRAPAPISTARGKFDHFSSQNASQPRPYRYRREIATYFPERIAAYSLTA